MGWYVPAACVEVGDGERDDGVGKVLVLGEKCFQRTATVLWTTDTSRWDDDYAASTCCLFSLAGYMQSLTNTMSSSAVCHSFLSWSCARKFAEVSSLGCF